MKIFGHRIIKEAEYQRLRASDEEHKKLSRRSYAEIEYLHLLSAAELKGLLNENIRLRRELHRRGISF
ncbi:MAG: hypothetical protein ABII09_03675 [Planctomycetota bacterium]